MTDRHQGTPESAGRGPGRFPSVEGYDLLEELGRGSVGVVYKARHRALNRLVALKMVVAGAHASPDQLARFTTEARAVAALRHPSIVQIHEIGSSGGLPFLSLEYVDGPPLDRVLAGRPQDPRDAARLIGRLADAIHVAHRQGILHRDIKPANVLLAADGIPKITDFGLAKDLEDHSSQTRTGTLLGTPFYMAPEQALGDVARIGPPVDIHSLGAILYEMLVGRPPFLGTTPYETTMQVVNVEPVPPSRLVGRLPADIETICLKSLQKDPAKRYHDAAALAEDCRRFVAGEPILSRPVSLPERAWRWCRRNPRVASLAASVAGLLVVLAAGSTAAAILVDAWRRDAERARSSAVAALDLAEERKQASDRAFAEAERLRVAAEGAESRAVQHARIASEQTNLALSTIQLLVDKVQRQLEDAPRTGGLKAELLETALGGLDTIAGSMAGAVGTETTALAAHMRLGAIYRQLGSSDRAVREYEASEAIARRRAASQPDNAAARGNLAAVLTVLGEMRTELRRDLEAARSCLDEALSIWRALDSAPLGAGGMTRETTSTNVAEACTRMAVMHLRLGDPDAAMPLFDEALARRRDLARSAPDNGELLRDLARSLIAIAEMAFTSGDEARARQGYRESIETLETVLAADPDDVQSRLDLAAALGNFGDLCVQTGSTAEAEGLVTRSLAIHRELSGLDSQDIDLMRSVGVDLYRLAVIDGIEGRIAAAAEKLAECLGIRGRMVEHDPANQLYRIEWMLALARSGDHAAAARLAESLRGGDPDAEMLIQIARCYAQCAGSVGGSSRELADRYTDRALEALEAAVGLGYGDEVSIRTGPDLAPLRGKPGFDDLLGRITAR